MNLLDLLKARIDTLPDGNDTIGLRSIFQHIEVAENHLLRGQANADETASTIQFIEQIKHLKVA